LRIFEIQPLWQFEEFIHFPAEFVRPEHSLRPYNELPIPNPFCACALEASLLPD
jgi:hypothetical protein